MNIQRYPLQWPAGWKRTSFRTSARFSKRVSVGDGYSQSRDLTVGDAVGRLVGELRLLGVRDGDFVISSNLQTRLDGLPYAMQSAPGDPGVAVYFRLRKQDRCLACDRWSKVADNIAAIASHIKALRAMDRYGVGTMEQAFAGYVALPAKGHTWRATLGFGPDQVVTRADVERAFKERARTAHPDVAGGSHEAMAALNAARDGALEEVAG